MEAERPRAFDVVIVGAGPAGVAAACAAAEAGRRVALLDDAPAAGGQIWRGEATKPRSAQARAWLERLASTRVERVARATVVGESGPRRLLVETSEDAFEVAWDRLVLATGARELLLPFPGWTLPGVFGAGGLQALAKGGWPVEGRRVVVAGSGPLLLAVAAGLREAGAAVLGIHEQAPLGRMARFGSGLLAHPGKLAQGLALRRGLRGVPYRFGWWPARAEGDGRLERVIVTDGRRTEAIACDALACGFGLVPSVELAALLGCRIEGGRVEVDARQATSIPEIFAAGEPTGVGGVDKALAEGEIAGLAAAGIVLPPSLLRRRDGWSAFARGLDRAFALRDELKRIADDETIVCRCEDVPAGRLRGYDSWRSAKLQTRCGMGPCQGRVCGAAARELFGWGMESVRPPVLAARVGSLMTCGPGREDEGSGGCTGTA